MDIEQLAAQLIRHMRGKRSQTAFSRHLGYSCNVLYTWESGRRWPTAANFMRVALKARIDVESRLAAFLGDRPRWGCADRVAQPESVAALLSELQGGTSRVELARRVGTNRVSVSRWLSGQAEPRLPDFLKMVEASSARLLDFVAIFAPPSELAECREAWEELQAQRQVAYGLPWSHAILRSLELSEYRALSKHQDGWLAKRLGVSLEQEQTCLKALAASGLIAKRAGHYRVSKVLTVDTRLNPVAGRELKTHWARVALERLAALEPNNQDLFSYNLFTVSEADFQRIRELHIAYYQELRSIVSKSVPAERVALVNLQLLRLDEQLALDNSE